MTQRIHYVSGDNKENNAINVNKDQKNSKNLVKKDQIQIKTNSKLPSLKVSQKESSDEQVYKRAKQEKILKLLDIKEGYEMKVAFNIIKTPKN